MKTQVSLTIFKKTRAFIIIQWIIGCAFVGIVILMFFPEFDKSGNGIEIIGAVFLSSIFITFFIRRLNELGSVVLNDHGLVIHHESSHPVDLKFDDILRTRIKIGSYKGQRVTRLGLVNADGRGSELEIKVQGKAYHFWFEIDSPDQVYRLIAFLNAWSAIEGNKCKVYKPLFMPYLQN